MYAAISADIVSSTSLSKDAMIELTEKLRDILCLLEDRYEGFWGRIVRGDSIECIMPKAVDALEIAILLKAFVKSFTPKDGQGLKQFHKYGLRVAIGIGEMKTVDKRWICLTERLYIGRVESLINLWGGQSSHLSYQWRILKKKQHCN